MIVKSIKSNTTNEDDTMLTVVVLNQREDFLQFLDTNKLTIVETNERFGLRSVDLTYEINENDDIPELFKVGNKLWVSAINEEDITDCLYVMNTPLKRDYQDNEVTITCEEVLTELNYTVPITQTEITTSNGFTLSTVNNEKVVTINYNALNYFFGYYFNIGIVQDCLSNYLSKIPIKGTMTLMSLLRFIEEETGNIFRTRYEKDPITNVIHRYLDFLNPNDADKDWELNILYNLPDTSYQGEFDSSDGTQLTGEEDVTNVIALDDNNDPVDDGHTSADNEDTEDVITPVNYTPVITYDKSDLVLRIINPQGRVITGLEWDYQDMELSGQSNTIIINFTYDSGVLKTRINNIQYNQDLLGASVGGRLPGFTSVVNSPFYDGTVTIPNGSKIQLIDSDLDRVLYSQTIMPTLSNVSNEVLDLGFNLENIEYEVDESDTYKAIAPIITNDGSDAYNDTEMNTLLNNWINLEVEKGEIIPMIVQKLSIKANNIPNTCTQTALLDKVKCKLGTYNKSSNYYVRPLKPNDNVDSNTATNSTFEFWIGTAYWKAPFTKRAGEIYVQDTSEQDISYANILHKKDTTDTRGVGSTPKIGQVETSDEDPYAIYNDVAMKLKDKRCPEVNVDVNVANLKNKRFNEYNVNDRVYIKIPQFDELISAIVVKTEKNPHDITENSVELSNYQFKTKVDTSKTMVLGNDISFKYPNQGTLKVQLTDELENPLPGKIVSFSVSIVDNGTATLTKVKTTRTTNTNGEISLKLSYNPGNYQIEANFGGDELYEPSSSTFKVNVSGKIVKQTKTVSKTTKATSKNTTTKKSSTKANTKKVVTKKYWTKCGLSPDRKQVISISQPSGRDAYKYKYDQYWKTVFENKCPYCGKAELRWDDGKKNGCINSNGHDGNKTDVPEGEVTCHNCDCDYDGVTGLEKDWGSGRRLKTIKAPVKSDSKERNQLINGKLLHTYKVTYVKTKTKNTSITRKVITNPSKLVRQTALSIVGNKTGMPALKAIVEWMDNNIWYDGYNDFQKSATGVLSSKSGNCCDQTRCFFELCDAAGLTEYFTFCYVHVTGHVYGRVTTKNSGRARYVDCASDYHTAWAYVCQGYAHGSCTSTFPTLPF